MLTFSIICNLESTGLENFIEMLYVKQYGTMKRNTFQYLIKLFTALMSIRLVTDGRLGCPLRSKAIEISEQRTIATFL
ncbi:hypothetical protein T4A_13451 [Trichinella pseudospiralis]|uniref:Uncharacterized protein n=1 Tax=Trichinella pseudospiralis TaxID=6337 RepID=A0A0V1EFS4_TRIPS|nr:hypothetical protein T4A_13451 [Trichinella pseudospiralis]